MIELIKEEKLRWQWQKLLQYVVNIVHSNCIKHNGLKAAGIGLRNNTSVKIYIITIIDNYINKTV